MKNQITTSATNFSTTNIERKGIRTRKSRRENLTCINLRTIINATNARNTDKESKRCFRHKKIDKLIVFYLMVVKSLAFKLLQ